MNGPLRISPEVIDREVEGAYLLYDRATDMIFGLNGTGSRVWRDLAAGAARQQVVDTLVSEFDSEPARVRADVDHFLEKLASFGLLASESAP